MRKTLFASIALTGILAGLGAIACGGDDNTDTPSPTSPATVTTPGATATVPAGSITPGATATRTTPASSPTTGVTPISGSTNPVTKPAVPSNFAGTALLKDVRTGLHPETASERIVFEFQGTALPPVKVEYVNNVSQCGSGQPVTLTGAAVLAVSFTQSAAHNDQGQSTFPTATVPGGSAPITQAKPSCDFEGVVAWGIGVTAQRPFVVTQLADPPRLVIDIAK